MGISLGVGRWDGEMRCQMAGIYQPRYVHSVWLRKMGAESFTCPPQAQSSACSHGTFNPSVSPHLILVGCWENNQVSYDEKGKPKCQESFPNSRS